MTLKPEAPGRQATSALETVGDDGSILRPRLVRSLVASGIGNVLEWYDWGIYSVLSPFIALALFNPKDPTSALLSTLAVFAVGFVARPLGGLVFGAISNRIGRKNVLLITMTMTALGSLVVAITPTYATIGGWAGAILLIARLAQGFGHGGESATTYTYIGEIAPARRRGLWGSSVFVCLVLGSVLAYGVSAGLTASATPAWMGSWGWRIAFLIGALLALYALYLRRGMVESVDVPTKGDTSDAGTPAGEQQALHELLPRRSSPHSRQPEKRVRLRINDGQFWVMPSG